MTLGGRGKIADGDILAEVRLFPSREGGRHGPTQPDHFGCPADIGGVFFDCRLLLDEHGPLAPGATAVVPITFLNPEAVIPQLKVGDEFRLWELRYIGTAKVIAFAGEA